MIERLVVGQKDTTGEEILTVYAFGTEYHIYEVENGVRWGTVDKNLSALFTEIGTKTSVLQSLAGENALLKRMARMETARSMQLCVTANIALANAHVEEMKSRLLKLKGVIGKFHYLFSCLVVVILFVVTAVIASILSENLDVKTLVYVATCGSIGGFLSIALNLHKLELDSDYPWYLNVISGASRIFIGVFGAIFTFFLIRSNLILGIVNSANNLYPTFAASVVAGFSETLVPNLLRKAESN